MNSKNTEGITGFAVLVLLAGIAIYAYLGSYNRYWADDWCYNADLKELGFIGTIEGYTYITTYASNRYSLTLFSGILYAFGLPAWQIMTAINITALCYSLYWCVVNIKKISGSSTSNTILALIALVTVYYSIYLAPHLYQSLYWRSGSLPYFQPIVAGMLAFALIVHQGVQKKLIVRSSLATGILSFLAGGFSEAGCATLATALLIYTSIAILFRNKTWARQSLPSAFIMLLFTLTAMIFLISSPTTSYRIGLYGQPAELTALPFLISKYAFHFIKDTFTGQPLPHLAIFGTVFLACYLFENNQENPLNWKRCIVTALAVIVIGAILVASSFAPSAYIEKVPPHPRTQIIPRFILTLTLVCVAWILGTLAGRTNLLKRFHQPAVWLFILVILYSIRSIFIVGQIIPVYAERALAWDEREKQIETAIANGETIVYVKAIDGLPVGGIRDFEVKGQGKPGYWINRCAARAYGLEAIEILSP